MYIAVACGDLTARPQLLASFGEMADFLQLLACQAVKLRPEIESFGGGCANLAVTRGFHTDKHGSFLFFLFGTAGALEPWMLHDAAMAPKDSASMGKVDDDWVDALDM